MKGKSTLSAKCVEGSKDSTETYLGSSVRARCPCRGSL